MRRPLVLLLLGVLAVLALTFASYVVLTAFHPEVEMRKMLLAMSRLETAEVKSGFSWTRGVEQDRVTTTIYTSGQLSPARPDALEHATRFRVVRLSRDQRYADLSGEVRHLDGETFLMYAPPGPEVPGADFSKENTWVAFEAGEWKRWGPVFPGMVFPVTAAEGGEWTPEGWMRLRALLPRADIFHVDFQGETETIGGVETRVIDGWLDRDAVRSYLRDLVRAREGREPTDAERVLVEEQASALQKLFFRFWIGKEDHRLYRLQAAGAVPEKGSSRLTPTDVFIEFSDFNQPFLAAKPPRATAFRDLYQLAYGELPTASGGLSTSSAPATFVSNDTAWLPTTITAGSEDTDRDGLDALVELFYGTDPRQADTDGDGASDGEEVLSGRNPRGTGSLFGFGLGR